MPSPPSRRRYRRLLVALVVSLGSLGACTSGDGTSGAGEGDSGDAAVTAESVLAQAGAAMATVTTTRFTIEQTGAEVFIDDADLIRFGGATGRYRAPSSADALLTVTAMGLTTEIGAVAVDGRMWISNPLTGAWETAPDSFSFDPSVLFHPDTGWRTLLTEGLSGPTLVGGTSADRHHVRGVVGADRVSMLTGGLAEEASEIDVWIDAGTSRVEAVAFDVEIDAGMTSWRLVLTGYDTEITIVAPDTGTGTGTDDG